MTRLIDLVETSNAAEFQKEFNQRLAGVVSAKLDEHKVVVAKNFFTEGKTFKKNADSGKKNDFRSARKAKEETKRQAQE